MKDLAKVRREIARETVAAQIEFPMSVAICAWCQPAKPGERIGAHTHGICLRHFRMMRIDLMKRAQECTHANGQAQRL
jgi:hypothetical protein